MANALETPKLITPLNLSLSILLSLPTSLSPSPLWWWRTPAKARLGTGGRPGGGARRPSATARRQGGQESEEGGEGVPYTFADLE